MDVDKTIEYLLQRSVQHDDQIERLREVSANLVKVQVAQSERMDEMFKRMEAEHLRTEEKFRQTEEQFRKTDEQFRRTDAKIEALGERIDKLVSAVGVIASRLPA